MFNHQISKMGLIGSFSHPIKNWELYFFYWWNKQIFWQKRPQEPAQGKYTDRGWRPGDKKTYISSRINSRRQQILPSPPSPHHKELDSCTLLFIFNWWAILFCVFFSHIMWYYYVTDWSVLKSMWGGRATEMGCKWRSRFLQMLPRVFVRIEHVWWRGLYLNYKLVLDNNVLYCYVSK